MNERQIWLPESDAAQNRVPLLFEFPVGVLLLDRGRKSLLPREEFEAARRARSRQPRPPTVQSYLKRALEYKERLRRGGMSRSDLARELSVTRVRVTQILNLLKLHPRIRRYILSMEPAVGRCPITEHELRRVAREDDPRTQLREFRRMVAELFKQSKSKLSAI